MLFVQQLTVQTVTAVPVDALYWQNVSQTNGFRRKGKSQSHKHFLSQIFLLVRKLEHFTALRQSLLALVLWSTFQKSLSKFTPKKIL
jgi:hypothetical protein